MNRRWSLWLAGCFLALLPLFSGYAEEASTTLKRLQADVEFLASDDLEGRGPGTEGLAKAAQFIRDEFRAAGLESGTSDGTYFQPFQVSLGEKVIAEETHLILRGPDGQVVELKLDESYRPFYTGETAAVNAPIVFAGYGISAVDAKYDDYRGVDVQGKVVLVIRREPQQDRADSVFQGTETSQHAFLATKLKQAADQKAAAVLLVNDPFTVTKDGNDQLMDSNGPRLRNVDIPFAQVTIDTANTLLASAPLNNDGQQLASVKDIEAHIDEHLEPVSQPLAGWTAELNFEFKKELTDAANVIGVLKGAGPLADECVVIGAHYDHLGYGGFGSRRPNEHAVHNGADDNASGTAAIMEIARKFEAREEKPARTVIFVAFSGEERGLLGSAFYVNNPTVPIENIVAMINFDMIGNLRNNELGVHGTGSGKGLNEVIDATAEDESLVVKRSDGVLAASDHYSFYQKHIPVAFFFTGITDLYHTPDDDTSTLNMQGMEQIVDYADELAWSVANMPARPEFVEVNVASHGGRGGMSYLGVTPNYSGQVEGGLQITGVKPGSPAEKGGLQSNDVITRIGEINVADIDGLAEGLTKYKPGETVEIMVKRGEDEVTVSVTLGEPGSN